MASILRFLAICFPAALIVATPAALAAQLSFGAWVRSDIASVHCGGMGIASTSCGLNFEDGGVSSSFWGSAEASVGYGTAETNAWFQAESLGQGPDIGQNYSYAIADWTDRYIVPDEVQSIEFVYEAGGAATGSEGPFRGQADVFMYIDGVGTIGGRRLGNGFRFGITLDRNFASMDDAFAAPISTVLQSWAGLDSEFVDASGNASADYDIRLAYLTLYDRNHHWIHDIPSITTESGTVYAVGVPEPGTWVLMSVGLIALALAGRGCSRVDSV